MYKTTCHSLQYSVEVCRQAAFLGLITHCNMQQFIHYILTRIVNFPVASSLNRGSQVGLRLTSPSLCLVASCCSYKLTALEEYFISHLVCLLKQESDPYSSLVMKWNYAMNSKEMHNNITRRLFLWTKFTHIFKEDIFFPQYT